MTTGPGIGTPVALVTRLVGYGGARVDAGPKALDGRVVEHAPARRRSPTSIELRTAVKPIEGTELKRRIA